MSWCFIILNEMGVVGWCEGVVYLTSLGRPTDIGIRSGIILNEMGVVRWCEGVVYPTSLGHPTDIGVRLGRACYPCSR